MTTGPPPGKPAPRHPYGPRPIGAVLPKVTGAAFRTAGSAAARLMADWPAIVGPALAATTIPRRLAAGTLTLGCAGPVALELQHVTDQLIERINAHAARPLVKRLRFVQDIAPQPQLVPRSAPPASPPSPVVIEGLPDGPLRDALAALGGAVRREGA